MTSALGLSARVVLPAGAPRGEWLAARRHGLGGSDVAAAVGLSPWVTPYRLWLDKTGRVDPDPETAAMWWGHRLEPVVLSVFDDEHDETILVGPEGTYADPAQPWRLANPDALLCDRTGAAVGVVEAKTGSHRGAPAWDDDEVPTHYVCQVQWYLDVLDLPGAWVVALLDTSTWVERWVERDREFAGLLTEHAAAFWWHVVEDVPPPVDDTEETARALARVPAEPGRVVELSDEWAHVVTDHARLGALITELQTERDALGNRIRAAMDTADEARLHGRRVATHRAGKPRRSCDLTRLAADYPDAYAACVSTAPPPRRLTVTNLKGSS